MMIEMPLPMPFSVISSPSQTRNIVPAVSVQQRREGADEVVLEAEVLDDVGALAVDEEDLAVALDEGHRDGEPVRVELEAAAALFALFLRARGTAGTSGVRICMMIEAVMYGYTPSAATLRFWSAPPEKMLRKSSRELPSNAASSASRSTFGIGHVRDEAEHDQHGQREEQLLADVFLPEGVDHRLQEAGPLRGLCGHAQASFSSASSAVMTTAVPPAASIFALAEALKPCAVTVSFLVRSPSPRIFTGSRRCLRMPASRSVSGVTVGAVVEALEGGEVDRLVGDAPLVVEAAEDVELPRQRELAAFERVVGELLAAAGLLALEALAGVGAVCRCRCRGRRASWSA